MKTDTRRKIMALIRSRCAEGVRPVEMVRHLGVTAQAVHYHLRALLSSGELEVVGRGPTTRYVVAGIPRFDAAIRWATSAAPPGQSPSQWGVRIPGCVFGPVGPNFSPIKRGSVRS
jgi:hypothetical protein